MGRHTKPGRAAGGDDPGECLGLGPEIIPYCHAIVVEFRTAFCHLPWVELSLVEWDTYVTLLFIILLFPL